jgi:hypothetical protein
MFLALGRSGRSQEPGKRSPPPNELSFERFGSRNQRSRTRMSRPIIRQYLAFALKASLCYALIEDCGKSLALRSARPLGRGRTIDQKSIWRHDGAAAQPNLMMIRS